MKLSTPLTKKRIRDHFSYNAWKYLLAAALSIFGWNMFYLQTQYRPPEEKRIDLYIQSSSATSEQADAYFKAVWEKYVPDMEAVESVIVLPSSQDNYMTDVQLTTYLAARQGDIYILSGVDYKKYAAQGAFLPLEDLVEKGVLKVQDENLKSGFVTYRETQIVDNESVVVSQSHLYGIPTNKLEGLRDALGLDIDNTYISITHANNNDENVIKFMAGLIEYAGFKQETEEFAP